MVELAPVLADLTAECEDLDGIVGAMPGADWQRPTPSPGWTVAHQIAHLAWTDRRALDAAIDPDHFTAHLGEAAADPTGFVDRAAAEVVGQPPDQLLQFWRAGRTELAAALSSTPRTSKLIWYGPPMSATSMATARLMEVWAHGQDVADALGITRQPTGRLRNVAHLGVRTRDFAFAANGKPPPTDSFRVELTAPDGTTWDWGPPDAAQRVTGPAADFCLLITQRRHRDDLSITFVGPDADSWLDLAQAFAGPPGSGRERGQFR
ncbi:MAG TPA: TIGR03084 family metal-binding protein [Jatrophihabitans sp.]|jgi:uncharacterized protein (TIGR03084 family)